MGPGSDSAAAYRQLKAWATPADLSGMRRTTAIALVSVALVSTAAVVAVYFVTHKIESSQRKDLQQRLYEEKIACLDGGGTWTAGRNADGLADMTGLCEHSEPTTAAPVVASPSSVAPAEEDGGGGNAACFLIFEDACSTARNVRSQVYKTTGHSLHMSLLEIVIVGRAICRALGPNSTDAEVLGVAANLAQTSDVPRNVALPLVLAAYANLCGRR